ncbi:MAG: hypothetical protein HYT87_05435 [Nitrospirae bacterium]|nr:hypothetical protein [Nitrospirota bacterium]
MPTPISAALLIVSFGLAPGCQDSGSDEKSEGRVSITNDESSLGDQVQLTDTTVPVEGVADPSAIRRAPSSPQPIDLKLVAEVHPPTVGGQAVQATSVAISGHLAFVSYNVKGDVYAGALNVFDVTKPEEPKLISQAVFQNADINAVAYESGEVFLAEATGDAGFTSSAVLERMSASQGKLGLENNLRVALSSFAGTAVAVQGGRVYATSGDGGGLFIFDSKSISLLSSAVLSDARWLDVAGDQVAVVQGTNGRLAVLDRSSAGLISSFPFEGADIPQSKSTVVVKGGKAFVAAGSKGAQVIALKSGSILSRVAVPTVSGLDASVVVTNAVSVHGDLVFISNGEAGVYVARATGNLEKDNADAPFDLPLLGRLQFAKQESVNHVSYRGNVLFVASGLGGLRILTVHGGSCSDTNNAKDCGGDD